MTVASAQLLAATFRHLTHLAVTTSSGMDARTLAPLVTDLVDLRHIDLTGMYWFLRYSFLRTQSTSQSLAISKLFNLAMFLFSGISGSWVGSGKRWMGKCKCNLCQMRCRTTIMKKEIVISMLCVHII